MRNLNGKNSSKYFLTAKLFLIFRYFYWSLYCLETIKTPSLNPDLSPPEQVVLGNGAYRLAQGASRPVINAPYAGEWPARVRFAFRLRSTRG
jgi:hypothetical protein